MKSRNLAVVRDVALVGIGTVGAAFGFLLLVFLFSSLGHIGDQPVTVESLAVFFLAPMLYAITGVVLMIVPLLAVGGISGAGAHLICRSSLGSKAANLAGGVLGAASGIALCFAAQYLFGPGMGVVPMPLALLTGLAAGFGFLLGLSFIRLHRKLKQRDDHLPTA